MADLERISGQETPDILAAKTSKNTEILSDVLAGLPIVSLPQKDVAAGSDLIRVCDRADSEQEKRVPISGLPVSSAASDYLTKLDRQDEALANNIAVLTSAYQNADAAILAANLARGLKVSLVVGGTYPSGASGAAERKKVNVAADYLECGGMVFSGISLTADYAVVGVNGLDVSYANLGGTVKVVGGALTTVVQDDASTAFTTDFVVGDMIIFNGEMRRITAIASATSLTVNANMTATTKKTYQKRNWLHVHFCCSKNGSSTCLVLSASGTAPTLPAGYFYSRRVGAVRFADTATNVEEFHRFIHIDDWWEWNEDVSIAPFHNLTVTTSATSYTDVLCNQAASPNARRVKVLASAYDTGGAQAAVGLKGKNQANVIYAFNVASGGATGGVYGFGIGGTSGALNPGGVVWADLPCDAAQTIQYRGAASTTDVGITVIGYYDRV